MDSYKVSIPNTSLDAINRMLVQRKVSGRPVQPWELEAAFRAAIGSQAEKQSNDFYRSKQLDLREQAQNYNRDYQNNVLDTQRAASTLGVAGNVGAMALLTNGFKGFGLGGT
jgi:hypothetical protein